MTVCAVVCDVCGRCKTLSNEIRKMSMSLYIYFEGDCEKI